MNININNYEEWMIEYMEGNLNRRQEQELNHFLESHPELRAELDFFQQTKLKPEMDVIFANKQILKKQVPGRVITMGTWRNYSIGIAAALLLFIGIRFINGGTNVQGIKYQANQIEKPVFAFENKKEQMDSAATQEIKQVDKIAEKYFAETHRKNEHKADNDLIKNNTDVQSERESKKDLKRDMHIIDNIEFAAIESIDYQPMKRRIKDTNAAYSLDDYTYALGYNKKEKRYETNETIVDKWNNTIAFAENVGGLLGIGQKEKEQFNEDQYKETSIKVFDIEYYNGKKTNN